MSWKIGIALCITAGIAGLLLVAQSAIIEVSTDAPHPFERRALPIPADATPEDVRRALLEAGLNETPILGDTGVSGHIARLERGQVTTAALLEYAEDLTELSRVSAAHGKAIPSAFWDVETPALIRDGWTPHAIVAHLSDERGRPYLDLLATAYARFYTYRSSPSSEDTALKAAFDILDGAHAYVLSLPEERRLQHGPKLNSVEAATLMAWQTLVAGTTRRIPGLGMPVFDHGFVGRFSVKTIYQYDVETAMSVGEVWGTSGFDERFVGPSENNNQIEHLTISALLQAVAGTSVALLDALELEKVAAGQSSRGEARADINLNNAINRHFLPMMLEDFAFAAKTLERELAD
ncbi:hypothetical protein [Roseobacter sinensis]|uniref:Lipoprotein n=1 Tax=Roseobacter sinensis TaxID=2931391 RepID=A0ABT3BLE4_9RHOB|nr:hypothetical protein [Roseobacter sp. WL0113]MCV3274402.1 hypothetical protein [Roseobacter sp. WL0113]